VHRELEFAVEDQVDQFRRHAVAVSRRAGHHLEIELADQPAGRSAIGQKFDPELQNTLLLFQVHAPSLNAQNDNTRS
jgi:hypothetical protein